MQNIKNLKFCFIFLFLIFYYSYNSFSSTEIWECDNNDFIKNIYKIDLRSNLIYIKGKHGEWQLYGNGNDEFFNLNDNKIVAVDAFNNKTIFNLLSRNIYFKFKEVVNKCKLLE